MEPCHSHFNHEETLIRFPDGVGLHFHNSGINDNRTMATAKDTVVPMRISGGIHLVLQRSLLVLKEEI